MSPLPLRTTCKLRRFAVTALVLLAAHASAEPVPVRHAEGEVHGFLVLRTQAGKTIATGDLQQTSGRGEVTNRLFFHFHDGSAYEETAVFTQSRTFRLVSYRLVRKGPTFRLPLDMRINCATGEVTVLYSEKGEQKKIGDKMNLPDDLANGLMPVLLKNLPAPATHTVSMLVATPKLRLVRLAISQAGEEPFTVGGGTRKATKYALKVELGGLAGVVAPLIGKQPEDTHVWILGGEAPAFLKSEGPLGEDLPVWRIELASPVFRQRNRR